jgi:iron complex transport system ATP-binding protein
MNMEPNMGTSLFEAQHLRIGYAAPRRAPYVVAEEINVALRAGELACLIGPNGAGKSTLLRTLAGLQPALGGQVLLCGDDVRRLSAKEVAQRLSMVLTDRADVGNLSAYEVVSLGRNPYTNWLGQMTPQDRATTQWAATSAGISHYAQRRFDELSDGERQKVMIARALAQEPRVIILDEPTAFLDLPHRIEILCLLRDLARAQPQRAILLSTHDLDLALRTADVLWLLSAGKPLLVGAPEDLVLRGAFDETFSRHVVAFDPLTGAFKPKAKPGPRVSVAGHGLHAVWTERALEREGFCIHANAPLRVEVLDKHGQARWRVTGNGPACEYHTIYEMLKSLPQTHAMAQPN